MADKMTNPLDDRQMGSLRTAVNYSRARLGTFRKHRLDAITQYVGSHYSDDGTSERVPVNLLALAINIYRRSLASNTPKVMASSDVPALKPGAYTFELAINHLLDEIKYKSTLRKVVLNALFGLGIAKVGLWNYAEVEIDGFTHDVGQPYCDAVSFDDWAHDISARDYEKVQFAGDKIRLPLEVVKASPLYTNIDDLRASHKAQSDDDAGEKRAEAISRGEWHTDADEFKEYIDLWELWLPAENVVVTLPVEGGKPIRIQEWEGPECGPYHLLRFSDVPDQLMPLAPVAVWMDIHELANRLFNKLGQQADRQRDILGYSGEAADDAKRIGNAGDGERILMNNPQGAQEYKFGGIDQASLAFFVHNRDLFSWLAGNLDTLGGLSPQAETLGQEELLDGNSSKLLEDMHDLTQTFNEGTTRDLGWYLWTDPFIEMPLVKRVPGTSIEIPVTFSPEEREGDFLDYNLNVNPYSARYRPPAAKLQTMTNTLQNLIIPMAPYMAEQGIYVNWEGVMRTIAKYTDMSEMDDILIFGGEPMAQRPQAVGSPPRPAVTRRENVRINKPGRTRRGADTALSQVLLGGGVQNSEAAAAVAPG